MPIQSKFNFLLAAVIAAGAGLNARGDDAADKGRDVFKQSQQCAVTVQVTQKISVTMPGRGGTPRENKQEITGTVVDPSGLTVLALSACDPSEIYQRMGNEMKIETELSDMKILLDDGAELPAEIVLRDKDLDLAFIRPKTKVATPLVAVDLSKSSPAKVLDQVVTFNRLNRAAGRAHSASLERISAVIQKPRTFYIPDSSMTATALGSPVFALDGNIVGIVVMRAVNSVGSNQRENVTSIILPAEDILKGAKQAPEAKGDTEKKDAPKEGADKKADEKK
jgi:hypothetical protein